MLQRIKLVVVSIIRILLRIFWIFPVNTKTILFSSYKGKQYSCNPKYIFEYVYQNYLKKYKYVWCLNEGDKLPIIYDNILMVKHFSFSYVYHCMTAKYIITNGGFEPVFPTRKEQVVIDTWHGGGSYKRAGNENIFKNISSTTISFVISSCELFSTANSPIWNISLKKFLPIGTPRNDIFFKESKSVIDKIYTFFNIDKTKKIVLYAPTYRGDYHNADNCNIEIDIKKILEALKCRFESEFIFLYRMHHFANFTIMQNVISATEYPDMQELLYAASILITDYSSCMWDFSFTYKPCFIFAPDLEEYHIKRGFYVSPEYWPFPLAVTNQQVIDNIREFNNESYINAVKKHHRALGSYETGTAAEQFCRIIFGDAVLPTKENI
ncbi:hypothetical protein FACS1894163_08430 [Spirochaetia bacterium]|nr:hypothetical protein FACS1894163_08430 [Spirochaetia bacterium]